ncbi:glycoside hydrolase family 88 protein [Peribacillus kribbensis]|uniref:glycoside hydrolase family 88 protein n=1 Tax=Peribacillus kribbensis TaxID=356658 RepID=UPI000412DAE9|nr:glycoside hydrolase family 88 protein [Peribacillus kribbensis]
MIIQTFLYIILLIVGLIILIDILPMIAEWFLRIHIGSYQNKQTWKAAVTNRAQRWLLNTPEIKVTDNRRLVIIDILKRNYTNRAIQHWQEAALLLGLSNENLEDNIKAKSAIHKYLGNLFDANGNWRSYPKHVDAGILAYAIMKLNLNDADKYKPALDCVWNLVKDHIGSDGTVQYRKNMGSYRYVDTIGFICPFLISYGIKYNLDECINLAIKQIAEYEKYGFHTDLNIPFHAYKIENKAPLGLLGWGRGLGWYAIGLVDAWGELPEDNKYKSLLREYVVKFAKSVMNAQQKNGSWNWTVSRHECRPDSSATANLCWFLLNSASIIEISNDCIDSVEKAINYLMSITRRNGAIDYSQGDTKDIGVYSGQFNIMPFTQGFSVRVINQYLSEFKEIKNEEFRNKKMKIV